MVLQHLEHRLARHAEDVELGIEVELGGTGNLLDTRGGGDDAVRLINDQVVVIGIAHELTGHGVHEERGDGVLDEEVGLVQVVFDDVTGHGQGKRGVRTGLHGYELVGVTGGGVEEQADIDDLRAVALGLDHVLGEAMLVLDRVGAPHDHVIGRVDVTRVGVIVAVGVAQVIVGGEQRAIVQTVCLHREGRAIQTAKAGVQHTGKTHGRRIARGQVPERERLRTVLLTLLGQLLGDLVECLIPADLLPLALAALADALERCGETIFVVGLTTCHDTLLADVCLARFGPRVIGGLRADDLAILDNRLQCAVLVVTPTRTRSVDKALLGH